MDSFEETYPCHSFAELVRVALALGSLLRRLARRRAVRVVAVSFEPVGQPKPPPARAA